MKQLKDKRVLITGATSGIGKAIAHTLLKQGAKGILTGRNEKSLKELKDIYSTTTEVDIIRADLSRDDHIQELLEFVGRNKLEIDIIIHCAGIFDSAPLENTRDEMLDLNYRINFRSPVILTRALLSNLAARKGHIVFINSTAATHPKANMTAYAASKAALMNFADVLYQEVYPLGISVSSIYPGRVDTPMQELVCKLEGKEYNSGDYMSAKSLAEAVVQLLTLPDDAEVRHLTIRPPLK